MLCSIPQPNPHRDYYRDPGATTERLNRPGMTGDAVVDREGRAYRCKQIEAVILLHATDAFADKFLTHLLRALSLGYSNGTCVGGFGGGAEVRRRG